MAEKIGIDFEASVKNLQESLKQIEQQAKKTGDAIDNIGKKFEQQAQNTKKAFDDVGKKFEDIDQKMSNSKTANPSTRGGGTFFGADNDSPWKRAVPNAFGHALEGNFGQAGGSLLGAAAEAVGSAFGPVGAAVGKMVGKVFDKIGQKVDESVDRIHQNWISTHYLKNSIGLADKGSFDRLYGNITDASSQIGGMLNSETIQLFKTVAKASGSTNIDQLTSDSVLAGQYGKALGMDVNTSGRFFGQMRSTGMATTEAQMRRFGMIIGEAVGKSGAFAKADEMMSAVANFATVSSRYTLTSNTKGTEQFAGLVSSLASGNIKDISGIAQIMMQADMAFRHADKNEAQANFMLAAFQRGINGGFDGRDVKYLLEQGLMGTAKDAFAPGTAIWNTADAATRARYRNYLNSPNAGKTGMQLTMDALKSQYGNDSTLLINATANLLTSGNMSQAAAIWDASRKNSGNFGNVIGRLQKIAGNRELTADQVLQGSVAMYGKDSDVMQLANNLRDGIGFTNPLDDKEKEKLEKAIEKGDKAEIRRVTAELVTSRNWEKDIGEKTERAIKDNKNAIDALATPVAEISTNTKEILNFLLKGEGNNDVSDYAASEGGAGPETDENGNHVSYVGGVPFTISANAYGARTGSAKQKNFEKYAPLLVSAAQKYGVDPALALAIADPESGFDPDAKPGINPKTGKPYSTAGGLLQMLKGTYSSQAKLVGLPTDPSNRFNPEYNAIAGTHYIAENNDRLRKSGLQVNPQNSYLIHFSGNTELIRALQKSPNANASSLFSAAASANPTLYFADKGKGRPRTVKEVADILSAKVMNAYRYYRKMIENGGIKEAKAFNPTDDSTPAAASDDDNNPSPQQPTPQPEPEPQEEGGYWKSYSDALMIGASLHDGYGASGNLPEMGEGRFMKMDLKEDGYSASGEIPERRNVSDDTDSRQPQTAKSGGRPEFPDFSGFAGHPGEFTIRIVGELYEKGQRVGEIKPYIASPSIARPNQFGQTRYI